MLAVVVIALVAVRMLLPALVLLTLGSTLQRRQLA